LLRLDVVTVEDIVSRTRFDWWSVEYRAARQTVW